MSDRTFPPVRRTHQLILAALVPLLVFSEAAGQSAVLRETAAYRTLVAMSLAEACQDPKYPRIRQACRETAPSVTTFVKSPHLNSVPPRTIVEAELASLRAELDTGSADLVALDSLLAELGTASADLETASADLETVLRTLLPVLAEFDSLPADLKAAVAEFGTLLAGFDTLPEDLETAVAEFGALLAGFEITSRGFGIAREAPVTRHGVVVAGRLALEAGRVAIQPVGVEVGRVSVELGQGSFATMADQLETATVSRSSLSLPSAVFAVTDFLVSRAKAELVQSAFQEVADAFEAKDSALYKLLPSTGGVLDASDEISYRTLMPTFKAAAKEDFKALPRNIAKDLSIYRNSDANEAKPPDSIRLLSAVGDAFMRLESGTDVFLILSDLHGLEDKWEEEDVQWGLQLFSRFAREFRVVGGPTEANPNHPPLDVLLSDPKAAEAYIATLLSELPSRPNDVFAAHVNEHLADIRSLAAELHRLVNLMKPGGTASDGHVTPDRAAVADQIATVFQSAVPLLATDTTAQGLRAEVQKWREQIQLAHSLWTAIEGRDYHRIVVLMMNLLPALRADSAAYVRILSFAASVASADDAEDLGEALEALADPVGSFRSRRLHNAWGLSLVSYVGIGRGNERITGLADSSGNYWGAFAPIGIEWSWGTGRSLIASIGIMGSLLDLGTLVSYRFEETDVETEGEVSDTIDDLPEVNLHHVFSPSVSLVFGVTQDYPVSVGITLWQFAPRLRTLKEAEEQVSAVRTSIFLAVDLTLLRF